MFGLMTPKKMGRPKALQALAQTGDAEPRPLEMSEVGVGKADVLQPDQGNAGREENAFAADSGKQIGNARPEIAMRVGDDGAHRVHWTLDRALDRDAEPGRARLGFQVEHLRREARAEVFVHADATPLRRGLLAAKMCGSFARIASAFEGEIKLDVVFGIEITPLGVEARNIARRHDQLSPMI